MPMIGQIISHYRIIEKLSGDAMGVVRKGEVGLSGINMNLVCVRL